MKRRRLYTPPSLSAIGVAVNKVFDRYSLEKPSLSDTEIRTDFIHFLWRMGNILANNRNKDEGNQTLIDSSDK
jgi:hypothetical protein